MNSTAIEIFLHAVRRRLDGGARRQVMARVLLAAAVTAVAWALAWRVFGYAAPRPGYAVVAGVAAVVAAVWILLDRCGLRYAAGVADRIFDLKDGLGSWLDFQSAGLQGEIYQLNERYLAHQVAGLDLARLRIPRPRKVFVAALVLTISALLLGVLPHGEGVRNRLAREELAAQRSAELDQQVKAAVEEIIKALSEDERKLLDPGELRKWAKEVGVTRDARESEKQLARLEQQIDKAMHGLEARQDEAVLKLAAGELAKSALSDVRQLGKQLAARNFDQAVRDLKAMKPAAKSKMTPEDVAQLRNNAGKSRDMAQRMADGARRRHFGKLNPSNKPQGKPGDPAAEQPQQAMDEMLEELDGAARELAKELEKPGEPGEQTGAMADKMDGKMDELGKRMGQLDARQKATGKLDALRRGLGEAREFAQGKTSSLGLARSAAESNQPGGLEPGKGTDATRREERDAFKDNGNLAELKGRQNAAGPSSSTVESAASGSGIAGRANVAKQREFKQQLEALVHRDDIPESLKLGVREYFEKVHETDGH
ncbi:MAG: hypothetical protein NTV46_05805 [Verrucomicrobia bacterium]|nr:hypothetical protein [Verrucomicrobiota bacterium]